ncbi:MAG: hypothetical protein IJ542_00985 [Clostridia bacterium]|nr:hypothetical protein [Clostridia bacterium]
MKKQERINVLSDKMKQNSSNIVAAVIAGLAGISALIVALFMSSVMIKAILFGAAGIFAVSGGVFTAIGMKNNKKFSKELEEIEKLPDDQEEPAEELAKPEPQVVVEKTTKAPENSSEQQKEN